MKIKKEIEEISFYGGKMGRDIEDTLYNVIDNALKESKIIKELINFAKEEFFLDLTGWTDIDDFPKEKIIKTKKIPTFDELFEKIAESGIESLTPEELVTLNQYSK